MSKKTKIVAKHIQSILLGFAISLIFTSFSANADTSKTTTPEVKYKRWYYAREGRIYHRFLPASPPKELYYYTRMSATANIDDTPEKETAALVLVDVNIEKHLYAGNWVQAFLLIANTQSGALQEKKIFKLYDTGTHTLEVPAATAIELQSPPYVFTEPSKDALKSHHASVTLVDLTGDGILDLWVEFGYAVAVISFQNGEFKEIFSSYTVPGFLAEAEYVDLDNDDIYEIKIPYSIHIEAVPGAPHLEWMSLYEWDGKAYTLNNERFYAKNNEPLIQLLGAYNYQVLRHGSVIQQCETYRFYLGLVSHYWHGRSRPASDLEWIIKYAENENYIQAAEDILLQLGLEHYHRGELLRAQVPLQYIATEAKNPDYRKDADAILTEIWNKTDDRETFETEYRRHLIRHYGDFPEVRTFIAGKKQLMSGSFKFPGDEDWFLRFYEAKYDLWPNETVRRELEKVRKAKAEGIPFHLIDWDNDVE